MADKKTYISKEKLSYIRDKVSSKVVKADEIRRIEIVDEYPSVEEQGVLYLKVIEDES